MKYEIGDGEIKFIFEVVERNIIKNIIKQTQYERRVKTFKELKSAMNLVKEDDYRTFALLFKKWNPSYLAELHKIESEALQTGTLTIDLDGDWFLEPMKLFERIDTIKYKKGCFSVLKDLAENELAYLNCKEVNKSIIDACEDAILEVRLQEV